MYARVYIYIYIYIYIYMCMYIYIYTYSLHTGSQGSDDIKGSRPRGQLLFQYICSEHVLQPFRRILKKSN